MFIKIVKISLQKHYFHIISFDIFFYFYSYRDRYKEKYNNYKHKTSVNIFIPPHMFACGMKRANIAKGPYLVILYKYYIKIIEIIL